MYFQSTKVTTTRNVLRRFDIREVPFVIITSIDAYAKALQLVESSSYFGMKSTQVKLFKQTKPHGHGDVHSLLYSSGLLEEWYVYIFLFNWFLFLLEHLSHYSLLSYRFRKDASLRWVLMAAIPAALGVSATKD
uniref:Uncharacterized protein n=1 Tax=Lactuca sativa TaxID=4236 RepID=A0A9R1X758_LACSA|nr:hypothetical protein LSAT_V11C600310320 [Lactuca sativa]